MRLRFWFPLALGCAACALAGCKEDLNTPLPEAVLEPVNGTVTVQGKPLAQAVISFLQVDEHGTLSMSETDAEGRYELTYMNRPGTAAARYKVVISYLQGTDGTVYGLGPRSGLAKPYGMLSAKERIVPEWSDFGRATQQTTVVKGPNTLDFDLKEPMLPPPAPEIKPAVVPDAKKAPEPTAPEVKDAVKK